MSGAFQRVKHGLAATSNAFVTKLNSTGTALIYCTYLGGSGKNGTNGTFGDGSADLLFQNQTSNQTVVWYFTNGAYTGGALLSVAPSSGWKIVGPR